MAGEEVSCRHQTPASEATTLSVATSLVSRRHQAPASEAATVAAMGRQEGWMVGARALLLEEGSQTPGGDGVSDRPRSHRGPELQHEAVPLKTWA